MAVAGEEHVSSTQGGLLRFTGEHQGRAPGAGLQTRCEGLSPRRPPTEEQLRELGGQCSGAGPTARTWCGGCSRATRHADTMRPGPCRDPPPTPRTCVSTPSEQSGKTRPNGRAWKGLLGEKRKARPRSTRTTRVPCTSDPWTRARREPGQAGGQRSHGVACGHRPRQTDADSARTGDNQPRPTGSEHST